jgi:thiosulfate/3-mercaptopyruvate sulfurtransferase
MKRLTILFGLLALVGISNVAHAADPLVSVDWLKGNLEKPGMVLLEVAGRSKEDFATGHIPGSVYTDYGKEGVWRGKDKQGVDDVMPSPDKLARTIGDLGIDNDTYVVLVPLGMSAADMGAATRVYWTFKVLGHDAVSILDGGLLAWTKEVDKVSERPVNPMAGGAEEPTPKVFEPQLRDELLATREEVQAAIGGKEPLVDNRSNDYFIGLNKSSKAGRGGTLPGAVSLPYSWLTKDGGGTFRTRDQLEQLYRIAGVPASGEQISFCNTGHLASVGWFTSSEILGNKDARLYDGSMAEWTKDTAAPVEQQIQLK